MVSKGLKNKDGQEFVDRLVSVNRVSKVVKGGKRFAFAVLVVVGDQGGRVGFGHGRAREVSEAVKKANESAKKSMIRVPLKEGRTFHHEVYGRHGSGYVFFRSAPSGTGIIAGGAVRAVLEALGVQDVVAKSLGSSNPYNLVRATFDALIAQESPKLVAQRRRRRIADIMSASRGGSRGQIMISKQDNKNTEDRDRD